MDHSHELVLTDHHEIPNNGAIFAKRTEAM